MLDVPCKDETVIEKSREDSVPCIAGSNLVTSTSLSGMTGAHNSSGLTEAESGATGSVMLVLSDEFPDSIDR